MLYQGFLFMNIYIINPIYLFLQNLHAYTLFELTFL